MLPPPLAPLLTPTPGCCAWLVSIAGWFTVAPLETPAPAEAGGVTMEPPPLMPPEAPPLVVPCEPLAPTPPDVPAPTEPDVWAWASDTAEAAQASAIRIVLVIWVLRGLSSGGQPSGSRDVARAVLDPNAAAS